MFPSCQERKIQLYLALALVLNFVFWLSARDFQASWGNVPPAPEKKYAAAAGLGDINFAYRLNGIMIQNLGDTGGRSTSLRDYDYERLTKWFYLQDHLDQKSNFIPYLAAYYFGGVQDPELFRPVFDYLAEIGTRSDGKKWRFLVQAIFIARYKLDDMDKALDLARVLAKGDYKNAPAWVEQMPAFIMSAMGEKDAAFALMLEILKSSAADMHPNEVNAMKAYMCERTLSEEDAAKNPLCDNLL